MDRKNESFHYTTTRAQYSDSSNHQDTRRNTVAQSADSGVTRDDA